MKSIIRPDLAAFTGYRCAQMEVATGSHWLNANEMPSKSSCGSVSPWNRYPNNRPQELLLRLSDYYGLSVNRIQLLRGSNEGINLLVRLCCVAGQDNIVVCPPTYGMYEFYAKLQGIDVISVPLKSRTYQYDVKRIRQQLNARTKLMFICSPNNPTGNACSLEGIVQLCQAVKNQALVVVDEAYIEFSEQQSSATSLFNQVSNCVVLRTLSKALKMASLRLGVVCGHAELIRCLATIASPYAIPQPCINEALMAFDEANLKLTAADIRVIQQERRRVTQALEGMDWVARVLPSQGNFLFVQANKPVFNLVLAQGFVVRDMASYCGIPNALRITMGSVEQNTALLTVLRSL